MAQCPGCLADTREPKDFTCLPCWEQVTPEIRTALRRGDRQAVRIYRRLLNHCKARRPLAELAIG